MKALLKVVQALAVLAAIVFVVALFANEPVEVDRTTTGTTATATGDGTTPVIDGAALFKARCASCHGADGGGGAGPKLADGRVVERFPDEDRQIAVVTKGRGGMPSFEGRLTEAEIKAIVDLTRTL